MSRLSSLRAKLADPPPLWPTFSAAVRGPALTARLGRILGIGFAVCLVTGLFSHYQYGPRGWAPVPAHPVWGYRLTQGVHVITGIALIPLTLMKLWSVYPRLFSWPLIKNWRHALERLSIAVLVSSALLELVTGFVNVLTWYPWPWAFVPIHFWLAIIVSGSVLLHLAVKWPVIIRGLRTHLSRPPADGVAAGEPAVGDAVDGGAPASSGSLRGVRLPGWVPAVKPGGITRRGALIAAGAGVGITVLTTVGQTFSPLESIAVLAPRRPSKGPSGVPINRTAAQAQVKRATEYILTLKGPAGTRQVTEAQLLAMATTHRDYPIACVEGWSASASWTGVGLLELMGQVGATEDSVIMVKSMEKDGPFRSSLVRDNHLRTGLLATHLHGQRLALDHGYPLRLIAPDRAGVLNTKWITELSIQ